MPLGQSSGDVASPTVMRTADETRTVQRGIRDTAALALATLRPGDLIDQYRIMRPLGKGGMGEVYLVRDTKLGRRVALKRVRPESLETEAAYRQFMFEARATATFSHPNIVTIYGVGEHGGTPYVALEYLEGDTLKQRLRLRRLQLQEVLRIGRAVARALGEAHGHGILHRDLKPANIMLPPDGRTRVVDFGLASQVGPAGEPLSRGSAETSHSTVGGGTPNYMAPEQWDEERTSTPATDLWSLGVVLFEMLTQARPFVADDVAALGHLVVFGDEPAPRIDDYGDFPSRLSDLVARCLTRVPSERPTAAQAVDVLDDLLHPTRLPATDAEGPYRGLLPFHEDHADNFFGREEEVGSLRERLRTQPILPVVGPSGAGKSSLVFAGLVPRLREAGPLTVVRMRPGAAPFFHLAQRILSATETSNPRSPGQSGLLPERITRDAAELASSLRARSGELAVQLLELAASTTSRILLVVDQLEELAVMVDADERHAFIDVLCAAADDAEDPVRVVLTLRHDFLDRVVISPRARAVFSHVAVVQRPSDEMLMRTLERPLASLGYRFDDPALSSDMVAAVTGEAACLPLLQFTAKALWQRRNRDAKSLTRQAYDDIGGVEGALVSHADGVLEGLDDAGLSVARELLLRLVTPERTRRVVRREQALDGLGPAGEAVLTRLVDARLIHATKARTPEGVTVQRVELTHESLVTAWSTLARWLDESREELALLREASQAAELWERRGRRPEELWEGDALEDALRRLERASTALPGTVERFLDAGRRRAQAHRRRWRVGVGAALALLTIVASVLLLQRRHADQLRERALEARDEAETSRAIALQEGARAALARRLVLESRAKLRMALEASDSPLARGLWWQLQREPLHWRRELGGAVYGLSFSPDNRELVVGCQDKVAYVFDVQTGVARELHGHGDQVLDVSFSPGGTWLATIGYDGHAMAWRRGERDPAHSWAATGSTGTRSLTWINDHELLVGSAATGMLHHWRLGPEPVQVAKTEVGAGLLGIAHHDDHGVAVGHDDEVELRHWPSMSLSETREAGSKVSDLVWLHDGRIVAGTERGAMVLDGREARPLPGIRGLVRAVTVSPDGKRIVAGAEDGRVWVWDAETLATIRTIDGGHRTRVFGVAFSPDGRLIASGGSESRLNLWRTDLAGETDHGHSGMVTAVAISPDGKTVYSGGIDRTVRVWNAETGRQQAVVEGGADAVRTLAVAPDGRGGGQLLSAHQGGQIEIRDVATMRSLAWLTSPRLSNLRQAAFDPRRRKIAVVSEQYGPMLFDYDGQPQALAEPSIKTSGTVALSNDGHRMAVGGRGVVVYDVDTGREVAAFTTERTQIRSLRFEKDDETLVSIDNLGRVVRFDLKRNRRQTIYHHRERLLGLALSPSGDLAVTGARGDVSLISPEGEVVASALGHAAEANAVAIDSRGRTATTGADDGTVRLWSLSGLQPLWRAPLLMGPHRLVSHRGWTSPATGKAIAAPDTDWARAAAEAIRARSRGDVLCAHGKDGTISAWSLEQDRPLATTEVQDGDQLEAFSGGCASASHGEVTLLRVNSEPRVIAEQATVMGPGVGDELLVATPKQVVRYDAEGTPIEHVEGGRGVSALTAVDGGIALGYRNGSVVVRRDDREVALDATASAAVTRLLPGPSGTLLVGFADGTVGLWDQSQGQRMGSTKLHGAVLHIALEDDQAAFATALGQHLVWDLSVFTADYCTLLRDIWRTIPMTWGHGHTERRAPPEDHACR